MKVIIAAAGEGKRWAMHLGIRKHQAPINGVPIIQRQVEQFNAAGIRPLILCHPDHPYDYPGADYTTVTPDPVASIDKVLSSRDLWSDNERTLIVFGDVYFSDAGFASVSRPPADWTVYGRRGRSPYNDQLHALFALSFSPGHHDFIERTCEEIAAMDRRGAMPVENCGRLLYWYQHVTGQPLHPTDLEDRGHWVQIRDETDDADKPSHYRMLQASVEEGR